LFACCVVFLQKHQNGDVAVSVKEATPAVGPRMGI